MFDHAAAPWLQLPTPCDEMMMYTPQAQTRLLHAQSALHSLAAQQAITAMLGFKSRRGVFLHELSHCDPPLDALSSEAVITDAQSA
jgi:hypothetical protein